MGVKLVDLGVDHRTEVIRPPGYCSEGGTPGVALVLHLQVNQPTISAEKDVNKSEFPEVDIPSTNLLNENRAMDIPPAPRPRPGTIISAFPNLGVTPVAASSLGGSPGNAASTISSGRPRANSTVDASSTGADTEHQEPTNRVQASEGGEESQRGKSARSKPRSLSDYPVSVVLDAIYVGGMGP
ncbi:hypothetical protein BZA77DRAFT_358581 [Pyronema omphalodes]|nr:hypothetical protein BZA77DRAFT_358581 [Pyronema omphalodes]